MREKRARSQARPKNNHHEGTEATERKKKALLSSSVLSAPPWWLLPVCKKVLRATHALRITAGGQFLMRYD
jgi:hypothetical protein